MLLSSHLNSVLGEHCSSCRSPCAHPCPASIQSSAAGAQWSFWKVNSMSLQWQLQRLPILLPIKPKLSSMACKALVAWPVSLFALSPYHSLHDFFLPATLLFFCSLNKPHPAQPQSFCLRFLLCLECSSLWSLSGGPYCHFNFSAQSCLLWPLWPPHLK